MATTIFTKKPELKKIFVEREFAGTLDNVWQAWTDSELLDQWWAPEPWKTETKSMDFKEGGVWLYSMVGPNGERHFAKFNYEKINPKTQFSGFDAFCDENGVDATFINSNRWSNVFTETNGVTKVNVEITFQTEEDLHKMVEMGFVQGFEMAHGNLDKLLAKK